MRMNKKNNQKKVMEFVSGAVLALFVIDFPMIFKRRFLQG